jgi:hypothetical protein
MHLINLLVLTIFFIASVFFPMLSVVAKIEEMSDSVNEEGVG